MAKGLLNTCWASLTALVAPAIGVNLAQKWKDADKKQRAAYLVAGATVATVAVAGRWLLVPFLGAGKLSEPKATHDGVSRKVKRPDGSELHVEVYGPDGAPAIVLTHGWTQDSTAWYYLKRDLAQRFQIIVWDLPGMGQSSGPSGGDYSLDKMARDLEAVIKVAERPVILVGHSLGGMLIQTFCRLFPEHLGERVNGLVLIDTTYINPLQTARFGALWRSLQTPLFVPLCYATIALSPLVRAMNWLSYFNGSSHLTKRLLGFAGRQTWRQVDFTCRLTAKASPAIAARMSLASLEFDEWNGLSTISVPVLILAGENDRVTRFDVNQQIQQRIPSARLMAFRPAGHYALFEHHEEFSRAVADFAQSCHDGFAVALKSSRVDQTTKAATKTPEAQARE